MNVILVLLAFQAASLVVVAARFDDAWRAAQLAKMPAELILHAPYTPFKNDSTQSINLTPIAALAAQAKSSGVTTIWVVGAMGQFDTLNVQERMAINQEWVTQGHAQGLYMIVHVGSTVLSDSVILAKHAKQIGADAIASVPPSFEQPASFDALFAYFRPIVAAGEDLPLFYYHLPGVTHYNPSVFDMMVAANTSLPALIGVKWVGDDAQDWFNLAQTFNSTRALLFAPEPKLQWFGLGFGRGVVLAEDFFAPTYIRMKQAYLTNNLAKAFSEQQWKLSASHVFDKYGGGVAERAIYKKLCKVDIGAPRLPQLPFDDTQYNNLVADLTAIGFFSQ